MGVTLDTVELMAEKVVAAFLRSHPGPHGPGRVVADVLSVAAVEVRYPIAVFVLMKADNTSFHSDSVGMRMLPGPAIGTR